MNPGTEARKCMKIVEFQKCPGVMHEWVKIVWTSRQMHEAWQVWIHVSTKYVREIYGWRLPLTFTQSPSVSELRLWQYAFSQSRGECLTPSPISTLTFLFKLVNSCQLLCYITVVRNNLLEKVWYFCWPRHKKAENVVSPPEGDWVLVHGCQGLNVQRCQGWRIAGRVIFLMGARLWEGRRGAQRAPKARVF